MMPVIRRGGAEDLAAVEAIQQRSPEAAHWPVHDYLTQDFRVAVIEGQVAGFLVLRWVAPDEGEVLNLATAPEFRRRGVARSLLRDALEHHRGSLFLEVRESNVAAQKLYEALGFYRVSTRLNYYQNPYESAIVMKFHSC